MMKTNGRLKKTTATSNKKTKREKGKTFVCVECGASEHLTYVEFGEVVVCNICGHKMVES